MLHHLIGKLVMNKDTINITTKNNKTKLAILSPFSLISLFTQNTSI